MSPAPGVTVTVAAAPPPASAGAPTGRWFVTGQSQRGAAGTAVICLSMTDVINKLGTRQSYSTLYDSLEVFFREGGSEAVVSRVVGPAAAAATISLKDQAGSGGVNTIAVTANSPGVWGNNLQATIQAGVAANTYQIVILYNGTAVEASPDLSSPADAVTWASAKSSYVSITNLNSATVAPTNNPTNGTFNLATGADDLASITETQWTNALTAFTSDMGPGQVSAPGRTTTASAQALISHATTKNRVALLDDVDTATASTIVTQAVTYSASLDASYATLCAPWLIAPGIPSGTALPAANRIIPPSAGVAALTARSDQSTGNPNRAAAGTSTNPQRPSDGGQLTYCTGVTQTYSQSDRALLNTAGVSVFRSLFQQGVQLWGFRSLSTNPVWQQLTSSRLRMAIVDDAYQIGRDVALFKQIDGQNKLFARFAGALSGKLAGYWALGAIYGETPTDAFTVDVSASVNTPATISQGQVNASIDVRMSPDAEQVNIAILDVPITLPV